jgi:hypothetical protein
MRLASKAYDLSDVWAAQELYHANGWTDGLPIVPPTRDAVVARLELAVADPAQLVGAWGCRHRREARNQRRNGRVPADAFSGRAGLFRGNAAAGIPAARGDGLNRRLRGSGCTERGRCGASSTPWAGSTRSATAAAQPP